MVSMAEIPVEIISSGYSWDCQLEGNTTSARWEPYTGVGVDGRTVDVEVVLGQHLGTLIDGASRSIKDTAKHILGNTELQALAGELDLGLLSP
jgi:hypothetical protein